ncbi:hypothetical protein Tco_0464208 [Tanacetum coccineum]
MTSSDEQHSQDDEVFTQIQPQITTVTNTNAKFPYLKKGEYDIWAMKMQNYITNSDLPCWNIVLNRNSRKKTTKDSNGNIKICPPVSAEEHLAVQRETKARTTLLTALPDDHIGDFYHLDDAKEIWLAIKARFGGNEESKKMQKSFLKQEFEEFKITEAEEKLLLVMEVVDDVIHSFLAESEPKQQLAYEDLKQIEKLDLEELDLKWQMAMLSIRGHFARECRAKASQDNQRYSTYKTQNAGKKTNNSQALISVDTFINWQDHEDAHADEGALKIYEMKLLRESGSRSERKATSDPLEGNYMPTPVHVEIDESQFSYGQKQTNISETSSENVETYESNGDESNESENNNFDSCKSNFSVSPLESASETVVESKPNVVMSKVWTDAPIIEEVDSDNEYVVTPGKANEKPSHTDNKSSKFINTLRDMGNKHDSRRHMGKQVGEGYAFPKKACFVCESLSHLIKYYDFHEKRMTQEQAMAKQNEKTNGIVLLQSGIVDLSSTRPNLSTPVPTGRQNLSKPVTTGRRNLPTPVPTGKAVPAGRPNYPIPITSGRTNNTVRPFPSVFKLNRPNTQSASPSKRPLHRASPPKTSFSYFGGDKVKTSGNPHKLTEDLGIVDSGCSRSMTGNRHRLENFQEFKGRNVNFGGGEGKITSKGTIRTAKLDFENMLYVKELQHFNLFSVSQICDKKKKVLFTETECLVLTKDFKLPDET